MPEITIDHAYEILARAVMDNRAFMGDDDVLILDLRVTPQDVCIVPRLALPVDLVHENPKLGIPAAHAPPAPGPDEWCCWGILLATGSPDPVIATGRINLTRLPCPKGAI